MEDLDGCLGCQSLEPMMIYSPDVAHSNATWTKQSRCVLGDGLYNIMFSLERGYGIENDIAQWRLPSEGKVQLCASFCRSGRDLLLIPVYIGQCELEKK